MRSSSDEGSKPSDLGDETNGLGDESRFQGFKSRHTGDKFKSRHTGDKFKSRHTGDKPSASRLSTANGLPSVDITWVTRGPKRKRPENANPKPLVKRPRKGRPAIHEEFPEIVPVASRFIEGSGFKAHRRRQEEIATCGSSLPEIRDHLLSSVPGLRDSFPKLGECKP